MYQLMGMLGNSSNDEMSEEKRRRRKSTAFTKNEESGSDWDQDKVQAHRQKTTRNKKGKEKSIKALWDEV